MGEKYFELALNNFIFKKNNPSNFIKIIQYVKSIIRIFMPTTIIKFIYINKLKKRNIKRHDLDSYELVNFYSTIRKFL